MSDFLVAIEYHQSGGEGGRTPVHKAVSETFYMLRRSLVSERCCGPSRHTLQSGHEIDSPHAAVAPAEGQPAAVVSVPSRRQPGHVTAR